MLQSPSSGQAGTTMTIYCTVIGPDISTFTWTKDHPTLRPSYPVKYDVNSMVSVLTIRTIKKAYSGNYTTLANINSKNMSNCTFCVIAVNGRTVEHYFEDIALKNTKMYLEVLCFEAMETLQRGFPFLFYVD